MLERPLSRRQFLSTVSAVGGMAALAGSGRAAALSCPAKPRLRSTRLKDDKKAKRIVLCADGTWNEPERVDESTGQLQPTNVLKVARAVKPRATDGTEQIVYYHYGVGTGGGLDEFTGGAFGRGIERNIRQLYRFIVFNYEPGDEIYLFGFSRGAFTVRTLVGFMSRQGLLYKEDEYYTPALYEAYEEKSEPDSEDWKRAYGHVRQRRDAPPIEFVGVWDTVGALGAPGILGRLNKGKYAYHNIDLHPQIKNAFHALAIDERREPFLPSLWKRPREWSGHLEQVWFPGVHSNIGGSYDPDGLANEALHWMVEKAEALGLEFEDAHLRHYCPCFNSKLHDSFDWKYRALFLGPVLRPMGFNLADGEAIHQSALDRLRLDECRYRPENLMRFLDENRDSVIATTTRVDRGAECPPLASKRCAYE